MAIVCLSLGRLARQNRQVCCHIAVFIFGALREEPSGWMLVSPFGVGRYIFGYTANNTTFTHLDARFDVIGAPHSLLSVSLSASQNLYTRRGTLVGLSGKADNVCGTAPSSLLCPRNLD